MAKGRTVALNGILGLKWHSEGRAASWVKSEESLVCMCCYSGAHWLVVEPRVQVMGTREQCVLWCVQVFRSEIGPPVKGNGQ